MLVSLHSRTATTATYKHDGSTTYCYYIAEKYSVEQPSSDSVDLLVSDTGSKCPVQIAVTIADTLSKNTAIPISFTAVVDDSNKDASFEFPTPIVQAVVPSYASTNSSSSASSATTYDVAVAEVVICDWDTCDIFTTSDGNSYSSSNLPNDFTDDSATFTDQEIVISKDGKYSGYAHIVINIAGNSRADFVTFFVAQVGDVAGTAPTSIVADSATTYCWASKDASVWDSRVDDVTTVRTDDNCPASVKAALSSTDVTVGDSVSVDWVLQVDTTSDGSTLLAEVSTTDATEDPSTGVYSVVPTSVLSGCLQTADNANCSSYAGGGSTTFDITQYSDYNLTNDVASYSSNYTFTTTGTYLLISRVVMANMDGGRVDMAVYSTVTVSTPTSSGGSSTFLILGLAIGGVILIGGALLFWWFKKRRAQRDNTKDIPFRQPMPPTMLLDNTSSVYTTPSSQFLVHQTPAAPPHLSDGNYMSENNYRIDNTTGFLGVPPSDHNGMHDHRDESFSLDPYARPSFNDMSEVDSDVSMRPSDTSKFSFQSGYDDDEEWEYDAHMTGLDANMSQYSDPRHGGTFNLQSSGMTIQSLPILEEDERQRQNSNAEPRSTTSSGWTINTH